VVSIEIGVAPPIVDAADDGNEARNLLSQNKDGVNSVTNVHTPQVGSITPDGNSLKE
jgi:hypothetical protein